MIPASSAAIMFICSNDIDSCHLRRKGQPLNDTLAWQRLQNSQEAVPTESPIVAHPRLFYAPCGLKTVPFQIRDRVPPPTPRSMRNLLICCVQEAVEQLVANFAGLAAPASLFYFDFLHLDVLEGRTQAVGYANTAKASLHGINSYVSNMNIFVSQLNQDCMLPSCKTWFLHIMMQIVYDSIKCLRKCWSNTQYYTSA